MKLKNSLPLSIFGLITILVVFYAFKDQKSSTSLNKGAYETSYEEENDNSYSTINTKNLDDSKKRLDRRNKSHSKRVNAYRLALKKQRNAKRFADAPIREIVDEFSEETKDKASTEVSAATKTDGENAEKEDDNKDEETDEEKADEEVAESESLTEQTTASSNELEKDYESIEASSFDDETIFVGTSPLPPVPEEDLEGDSDTDNTNVARGGQTSNNDNDDNENEGFGDLDLSQLSTLIEENKFDEVQFLVNSSNLSTFKREALQILVTSSSNSESKEQIGSILLSSYFSNENLGLFTQSMVTDNYSIEEKGFMGTLILQSLSGAPQRMSQPEFIDLYYNGVRAQLPSPDDVGDASLSELYATIEYSIEENFSLYSSNSQVAVGQ